MGLLEARERINMQPWVQEDDGHEEHLDGAGLEYDGAGQEEVPRTRSPKNKKSQEVPRTKTPKSV